MKKVASRTARQTAEAAVGGRVLFFRAIFHARPSSSLERARSCFKNAALINLKEKEKNNYYLLLKIRDRASK